MGNDLRDGSLPDYAVRQIRKKAKRLAGHYGFGRSDQDDIEQELKILVWQRLPKHKKKRGHFEAFLYWVIEKAVATLIERQTAAKRGGGRYTLSLDYPIHGAEGSLTSASEVMEEAEAGRRLGLERKAFTVRSDLSMELQAFLDGLSRDLRDLCERLLQNPNLTDISRETGIPRGTLYERREELRQLMEQAGLLEYLPRSGASESPPVGGH